MNHWKQNQTRIIACFTVLCLLAGCAHGPTRSDGSARVTQGAGFWTNREIQAGRQIHQQITSTYRTYTEPRLVGYVTRVGRSITRVAGRKDLPYLFTVLYDDRLYATSAPGGFIYVTTGFLSFIENESELASVLAHEVAELQFRDPLHTAGRRAVQTIAQAGALAAPFFGVFGVLIAGGLVALNAVAEASVPSADDRVIRADQKALSYLVAAGHDPQGYLDLMGRLVNSNAYWSPYLYDYSTSRPLTMDRYQSVIDEFKKLPLEDRTFSVHRDRYLAMTQGVREIYQR